LYKKITNNINILNMDEISIGDKIMFHVTGNHNMGYTKGKKYVGTVLSIDHRSRLHVRAAGMPGLVLINGRWIGLLIRMGILT
jgi:hypothetical protein